jgi:hypothetical protein
MAWGDQVLAQVPPGARALFKSGRFVDVAGGAAVFALPNAIHRDRCEARRKEVERVLAAHFGRAVPLQLVVADEPQPTAADEPDTAGAEVTSTIDHVLQAFEGAEVVEE